MYTINTQLTYFNYGVNSKRLIVNLKWYKLEMFTNSNLKGLCFTGAELEEFKGFIDQNRFNFPGSCFVEQTNRAGVDLLVINDLFQSAFPYYLVLSKNPKLNQGNSIYQAENITLMDENYKYTIDYPLDFDLIGKIEIYKSVK
ncbi:hypothetical protein FLA105534_00363 [Flavobacterium bizetiae]|uniref:Uncharacterized protein n=1 Tax=Flavobacterium bizetiae TaxID=2704140 RepID=A0A6J4G9Y7_9FLAO|nr:hypothetical protein [Flavobacterium bizetiae]CAA9194877.1 hypothetical protein FLA105534_00363 [Flavobacterium bizetiae]CAD5342521.1 hypothetical protein FLA105535_02509 [Flavobacterium bizetiae]CAD5348437.1 hypothetical protein FLA105534_02401 [Flavobacterium bizetiae]